ncbi:hypothetical protein ZIOFF_075411 [Zingiber officinale]|uniref:Uncharacterized protein n=1 Tax=Zingiber officinale TaxID=94328 RepID=A0A8J5C4I3_ZINOF|nr:hypothetical protein ZIOFF_075411 [Zingiber officinale]
MNWSRELNSSELFAYREIFEGEDKAIHCFDDLPTEVSDHFLIQIRVKRLGFLADIDGPAVELGHIRDARGLGSSQWVGVHLFDDCRRDRTRSQVRRYRSAACWLTPPRLSLVPAFLFCLCLCLRAYLASA